MISLVTNMGLLHMNRGEFSLAEPFRDRAITNGVAAGEVSTASFETIRHNYGALKMLLGQHTEADQVLSSVFENRQRILGADHFETLMTLGLRGENLRRDGKLNEAIAPLSNAYEGLVEMFGADNDFSVRTAQRLVQIHEEMGNTSEVELWQSRSVPSE